jgi:hypothetical protein
VTTALHSDFLFMITSGTSSRVIFWICVFEILQGSCFPRVWCKTFGLLCNAHGSHYVYQTPHTIFHNIQR